MAYDQGLAERLRELLQDHAGIAEKKMFGGLCFLSRGYMFVGIVGEALMARVGPDAYEKALCRPHVRVMDRDLKRWVDGSLKFVGTLPEK